MGQTGNMTDAETKVLVVDDEPVLAGLAGNYLERAGMQVRTLGDGLEAVRVARDWNPDVIVLDLGLPGLDGIEACRQVRTFSDCYIVMLTARTDEVDTLVGLSVGADDYMTKPFSGRELVARVQVLLRRPRTSSSTVVQGPAVEPRRVFGDLVVDPAGHEAMVDGALLELTPTEFAILDALSGQPRVAWSREQLIRVVWGAGWVGDEHLVDVHIAHLRKKLGDDPSSPRYVRTVRGVGYRMGSGR